jgi:hypothetical protein
MMFAKSDAHELCASFGFTPRGAPARFMALHRPSIDSKNKSNEA